MKKIKWITTLCVLLISIMNVHAQNLTAAEYFWDSDPGQGNGTAMTATDGSFNEKMEEAIASVSSLPANGSHVFNARFKDAANHWSPVFKVTVNVMPSLAVVRTIKITQAECWWDADPGQGNGIAMLAFDGNFDAAMEEITKSGITPPITQGNHTFSMRVKDGQGNWGVAFKTVINILPNIGTVRSINITSAEYFFDTDPGQGNGSTLLALDGNFNQSIEAIYQNINIAAVSVGQHVLNIRVRDAINNWGPIFKTVINVQPNVSTVRDIKITAGEYFFDNDPGNGSATPMIAFDGNFGSSMEVIAGAGIPQPIAQGIHVLFMRAKDVANNWGPTFGVVVNVDTSINAFTAVISGTSFMCTPIVNPQTYAAPAVAGNSYVWAVTGGSINSGQGTNSISVNWSGTGSHQVSLIECNNTQTYCDTVDFNVIINNTQTINITRNICQGDSELIGGIWQNATGVYQNTYTGSNNCDSIRITTLNVNTVYSTQNSIGISQGDSLFVGGAWQTNAGTYYDYYLTVNGCDSVIITVLSIFTLVQQHSISSFSIYPHPFHDFATIVADKINTEQGFIIYNSLGEITLTGKLISDKTIINTADLAPGIYFLLIGQEPAQRFKLVKM